MSLKSMYGTDKDSEQNGVWVEWPDFRVRVSRAGGSNTRYYAVVAAKAKPHRRAIQTKTISPDVQAMIGIEALAEACVMDFQYVKERGPDGKPVWERGIKDEDENGDPTVLEFTPENVVAMFIKYPDFAKSIAEYSDNMSLFRDVTNEDQVKN